MNFKEAGMKIQLDNIEKELREEGYLVNLYQDDEDYYLRVGKRISDDELPMRLIPSVPIGRVIYFDSKYHFKFSNEAKYERHFGE